MKKTLEKKDKKERADATSGQCRVTLSNETQVAVLFSRNVPLHRVVCLFRVLTALTCLFEKWVKPCN